MSTPSQRPKKSKPPEKAAALIPQFPASAPQQVRRLTHDLEVHQAEMTMQNEELKRIQIELEAARDRFAALYDLAPNGYLTLDPEGEILEVNLTAAKILERTKDELIGQRFTRFIARSDQDIFYFHRQEVYLSHFKKTCELKMLKADGATVPIQLETIAMHDEADFRQECLVALSDITERLRAEEERARLAAIVQSSSDAIISHDLNDVILSWNAGAEQLLGYSAAEAVGRPFSLLVPADQRGEFERVRQAIQNSQKLEHYEAIRVTKAGRTLFVSAATSPIRDSSGAVVGISTILRDITPQKEAEEALQRSEHNLADFFSEAPLGLLWVSPAGLVQRANQAQLELLNCTPPDLIGQPIGSFCADPELANDLLARLAQQETLRNYHVRFRAKDGSLKHVLVDANSLWQEGRLIHSRWFIRDITRRKELEREILAISEREQRRIGQDLHDDLGQQLTGIEYLAQTLAGQLKSVSKPAAARATEIAGMVQRATSHARELAHGLSPISLEADGLMVALRQLAARTKQIFRVDCRFRCSTAVHIHDPEVGVHLYRIAQEAVSNAIKHGKARRIDIGLVLNGERVVLAVSDDGIGMPKKPRRRKGMGLRVMQYRAGVIGGSLVVQRQPDGGTTFVCVVKGVHAAPKKKK